VIFYFSQANGSWVMNGINPAKDRQNLAGNPAYPE
jgi:hypothetical protein